MRSSPCFLYFAYGSNMLSRRLRERTPSAVSLGAGRLRGHELRWHKRSVDGSGKCDAWVQDGTEAWLHGVVYRIAHADKPRLDTAEALGVGYAEKQAVVETAAGPRTALLYVALQIDAAVQPYDWYHAMVVAGAVEHGLPVDHIERLRAVGTRADPDAERARRHRDLLRQG